MHIVSCGKTAYMQHKKPYSVLIHLVCFDCIPLAEVKHDLFGSLLFPLLLFID